MKRWFVVVIAVLCMLAGLTACGGASNGVEPTPDQSIVTTPPDETPTPGSATVPDDPTETPSTTPTATPTGSIDDSATPTATPTGSIDDSHPDVARASVPKRPGKIPTVKSPGTVVDEMADSRAAAATNFARWWDYLKPTGSMKDINNLFIRGLALCVDNPDPYDTSTLLLWVQQHLDAYSVPEAEALVKAATEALCVHHPKVHVTTFEQKVADVKAGLEGSMNWDTTPWVYAYGYFAKAVCSVINRAPAAVEAALKASKLEMLIRAEKPTPRGFKTMVRKSALIVCGVPESTLNDYWF